MCVRVAYKHSVRKSKHRVGKISRNCNHQRSERRAKGSKTRTDLRQVLSKNPRVAKCQESIEMNWVKFFDMLKVENPREYYNLLSELVSKGRECPNSLPKGTPFDECRSRSDMT